MSFILQIRPYTMQMENCHIVTILEGTEEECIAKAKELTPIFKIAVNASDEGDYEARICQMDGKKIVSWKRFPYEEITYDITKDEFFCVMCGIKIKIGSKYRVMNPEMDIQDNIHCKKCGERSIKHDENYSRKQWMGKE